MVMNFTVTFSIGKFGNSFISPWTTIVPPLRLSASTPSRIGMVPAPAVQSSATSTPLPPVISMMRASGSSLSTSMVKSAPSSLATSMRARSFDVPVTMMISAPVRVFAVTVLAEVAPLAFAAGDVVLDEYQIAFLKPLAPGELAPRLGDGADILVAHDHRALGRRRLVKLDIGSADSGDLHLHQGGVVRDIRHRVFADLGLARAH